MNKTIGITSFLMLTIFMLLFFLFKPYESFREVRNTRQPVTIVAEIVNVTGSPQCAKLYTSVTDDGITRQQAVFLALPDDMPAPDDGDYSYQGNRFELTGFTYDTVFLNKITGTESHKKSRRFDVTGWEIITPYSVLVEGVGNDQEPSIKTKDDVVLFRNLSTDPSTLNFRMDKYIDCLEE